MALFQGATALAQSVSVYPQSPSVRAGLNQQFSAGTTGLGASTVTWAVNDVVGGNATVGLINSSGYFTAPPTIALGAVTVQATSTVNTSVSGTSTVTLLNPIPAIISVSPTTLNTGDINTIITGKNFLSGSTVTFGGVALTTTYISSTQLQITGNTSLAAGTVQPLTVTNPNPGSYLSTLNYTVQPPISVSVNPATASLYPSATVGLSGTVHNTSNVGMTWLVNGISGGNSTVGTISPVNSQTPTFTAPAVPPSPNTVNVQAQSTQDPNAISAATVLTLNPSSVSVSPITATPRVLLNQQFSASTKGLSASTVSWAVNGVTGGNSSVGTISGSGLYTGPAALYPGAISVQAISTVNPSIVGTATVTLWNPIPGLISISPTTVNTGNFNLTVTGQAFVPVATATFGGVALTTTYISATQLQVSGNTTAAAGSSLPLTITNPDPGSASSTINYTVSATISVTASPATASLRPGATQVFTGAVFNTSSKGTNWYVNGIAGGNATVGTISLTGASATYTAPATPPSPNTVNIQAQSAQDTTAWSVASVVTVMNPLPTITSLAPTIVHFGPIKITVTGTGFVPSSQVMLGFMALTTQFVSTTQVIGRGTAVPVIGGLGAVTVSNPNPGAGVSNWLAVSILEANPVVSYQSAFHFLEHASWGPTPQDVDHVQQVGFTQWFTEQQNAPLSTYTANPPDMSQPASDYFYNALSGQDQLRQRVAFALSQIFVVSAFKDSQPSQMVPYYQLLEADAFGNFYNLMSDVTLNPSMGRYLDMANNVMGMGPAMANENYGREVMQLFSIGTTMLNIDGSPQLDTSGNPVPTYTQTTVQNFARVFTGWTFPTQPGFTPQPLNPPYYTGPMAAWEANHDTSSKTLLNGEVVPANQSAAQDVQSGLRNIFNHPNVGPFIALRLIQHLVTGNPSPAYIQRIAQVFNDNGTGTRGDLWAVVQAILLDSEARLSDNVSTRTANSGHLREPVLYITTLLRNLNTPVTGTTNNFALTGSSMGQQLYFPLSVFSYYQPSYLLPGSTTLLGPEFQTLNSSSALERVNYVYSVATNAPGPGVKVDLSPFQTFASDPPTLVQAMSNAFLAGQMPTGMQNIIVTALNATTDPTIRVQNALYLTTTSPMYQSER